MSDSIKYYYLKLKEDFFNSDAMIVLENLQDGYKYSNILLKLYLKSLKDEGRLMLNGRIPYNTKTLAQVTNHSVGDVELAIKAFEQLGLVEILDNGAIYMLDIQNYIGRSSTEADRIRNYRNRIETEKTKELQDGVQMYNKSTPEIEIEIEIELEKKPAKPKRHKHGEYGHILLTDVQYEKLKNDYPSIDETIKRMDEWIQIKGKSPYKDFNLALRKWLKDEPKQSQPANLLNFQED